MTERIVIAIPARHGSTRLPGKPLLMVAGKPLIAHVIERARLLSGGEIVVATDDARIADVAAGLGVQTAITRDTHATGSDRLAEVADQLCWPDDLIVVNLQGDEPLMPLSCLQAVVKALREDPDAAAATLATPITSIDEMFDPACVKVVCDVRERALYFSRAPVPWARDTWSQDRGILPFPRPLRHLGLYAYRASTLRAFAALAHGQHERIESLEQLRLLENGLHIAVRLAPEAIPPGVDTPADVERVSRLLGGGPQESPARRKLLFVCMGNICRSPLAEAYARHRFGELGVAVEVASAGTIGHHEGERADQGALLVAAKAGLDLSSHRARRVRDEDFANFDLILALDDRNLRDLHARANPEHVGKLKRLLDFAPACGHRDVPDPYGQSQAVFAHSLTLIRLGVDGLGTHLSASS
ncbi:MAG: 3-deoxy-manno-octulosonate cytidylyltransferase [Rhodanobacteraceae bacterium]|nr:3-deoxy-manno-octulosonate cytidylyltransferase [Rhodanobacteraceae bacterium]